MHFAPPAALARPPAPARLARPAPAAPRLTLLLALLLPACPSSSEPPVLIPEDADEDGSLEADDCNDSNASVHPGAVDPPDDGLDQDCNGVDAATCFYDGDGDGFGWTSTFTDLDGECRDDDGDADVSGDCDDSRPDFSPDSPDQPDDGFDQDCSGADTVTCFLDADGDGAGGADTLLDADGDCADFLQAATGGDCDDDDPDVRPGAADPADDGVDQDCNGLDATLCSYDGDEDGYGHDGGATLDPDGSCDGPLQSDNGLDCDDAQASIYPGATEVAGDGYDQDCNGADAVPCYGDADGDGFGAGPPTVDPDGACTDVGQAAASGDCDDAAPATYPFAPEFPDDGIDEDCDGVDSTTCFFDGDGDGFGWPGTLLGLDGECSDLGESYAGTDCDDAAPATYPLASETADDGLDQDCSGADTATCYIDGDGDGTGGSVTTLDPSGTCAAVTLSSTTGDCNDSSGTFGPSAYDFPGDAIDQDCNGVDAALCYYDGDSDGFGWTGTVFDPDGSCTDDPFQSPLSTDCDDSRLSVYPNAPVVLGDGIDQNCDGTFE